MADMSDTTKMAVPLINDASSSTASLPASSSSRLDGILANTITPISSASPLPITAAESTSSGSGSVATADLRKELNQKLQALLLEESSTVTQAPSANLPLEPRPRATDLPEFDCAFGFSGAVDEPAVIPETKDAFVSAVMAGIEVVGGIQKGLQSYQTAINSRDYHIFSTEFLINQNTAAVVSIDQLDQITAHLKRVQKEAETIGDANTRVKKELLDAFRQAQPWVMRTRAILRHCHVFYKINFVLASEERSTGR